MAILTTSLRSARREVKIPLRSPVEVMRLARLGSFHASRLSFMRSLLRRLKRERWHFDRTVWLFGEETKKIAGLAQGIEGVAVYRARQNRGDSGEDSGEEWCYSLVCFAHEVEASQRSDRVIAEAWDTSYALYDGMASDTDIARLSHQAPRQEAGRFRQNELVVSRANKSVRLFEHVVSRLSEGQQPEQACLERVGYLLRTTAVYGNGKFGLKDREQIESRALFRCSFHAELFAVFLIRQFSLDYVEHVAFARAPERAVKLNAAARKSLGIGNATGLGMAPFLVTHPVLLERWIGAREQALAHVRARGELSEQVRSDFETALIAACEGAEDWQSADASYAKKKEELRSDLAKVRTEYASRARHRSEREGETLWDGLFRWGQETLSVEGEEMLVSLLLEPQGSLVDELADGMAEEEDASMTLDGRISVAEMRAVIESRYEWCYRWALSERDYESEEESRYFWYVSEEKLEPRLGERALDEGAGLELPLTTGWDVSRLYEALAEEPPRALLGEVLLRKPQHRFAARRVQLLRDCPYAEIRENLVGATLYPIDLLRCKLSFFGATRFDPRSDRWLRIAMYRGAPEAKGDFSNAEVEGWGFA